MEHLCRLFLLCHCLGWLWLLLYRLCIRLVHHWYHLFCNFSLSLPLVHLIHLLLLKVNDLCLRQLVLPLLHGLLDTVGHVGPLVHNGNI